MITLAAQACWGVEAWTRRGEAFAVYYNLFSRMSICETRDGVLGRAAAARRAAARWTAGAGTVRCVR